jgi:hypothetical protein
MQHVHEFLEGTGEARMWLVMLILLLILVTLTISTYAFANNLIPIS